MKLFIASDIHGSAKYCQLMLEAFLREGADKLLLLGDVLYHGPRNPLPEEYSPKFVAEMLAAVKRNIICVRGNCDSEVDQMVLPFPILSDYSVVLVDGLNICLSHGHKRTPPLNSGDVYITGHTHIPMNTSEDGHFHLNPGSIALPKDGSRRGYIVYENGIFLFKTLEGEQYDKLSLWNNSAEADGNAHTQLQQAGAPEVIPAEQLPIPAPIQPQPEKTYHPAPQSAPEVMPAEQTPIPTPIQPQPEKTYHPAPQSAPEVIPAEQTPIPTPIQPQPADELAASDAEQEVKRTIVRRKIVRRRR